MIAYNIRCASQERVAEIKSGANYCCSYGFWSLNSKRSTNVTEGTNMEITSLACFGHLLIKGHFWVKVNTQILNWWLKLNWRASNRDRSNWLRRFGSGVVHLSEDLCYKRIFSALRVSTTTSAYWWKDTVLFWFDWSGFMTFAIGDMKRTKSWTKNRALSTPVSMVVEGEEDESIFERSYAR